MHRPNSHFPIPNSHFPSLLLLLPLFLLSACGSSDSPQSRQKSADNLSAIAKAATAYSMDNGDRFPRHLAILVAKQILSPKSLINPRATTATTPAECSKEDLINADNYEFSVIHGSGGGPHPEAYIPLKASWDTVASQVDDHSNYILATAGMTGNFTTHPEIIIAWEKPDALPEGITIAFADTHTAFIRFADLPAALETNNTARASLNQPLLAIKDNLPIPPDTTLPPPPR